MYIFAANLKQCYEFVTNFTPETPIHDRGYCSGNWKFAKCGYYALALPASRLYFTSAAWIILCKQYGNATAGSQ